MTIARTRKHALIFLLDVAIAVTLVIAGYYLTALVFKQHWMMPAALLPASLYLKFRLPGTWNEFLASVGILTLFGLLFFARDFFGIGLELFLMIIVAAVSLGGAYHRRVLG